LLEADQVDVARGFLEHAAQAGAPIVLPSDLMVAARPAADAHREIVRHGLSEWEFVGAAPVHHDRPEDSTGQARGLDRFLAALAAEAADQFGTPRSG
jgi:hypothetical protein